MGQVLHKRARTTEEVRRDIQNSKESLIKLSGKYGINVYNWGSEHFERSKGLILLNEGKYADALEDFKDVDSVHGQLIRGLVVRRTLEAQVWNGGTVLA